MLAALVALALILYACSGSGSGKKKPVADGKTTSPAASQSSLPASGGSSTAAASGGATASSGGASGSAPSSSAVAPSGSAGGPTGGTGGATGGSGGGTGGPTGGPNTGTPGCQLSLLLSSQNAQYAQGDQPAFTVTALNKGTADCDVDFSPKSMVLNIFSGSDRIWSSADCGAGAKDVRGIAPGSAQTVTYTWNRVRSSTGCAGGAPTAKLGMYFGVVNLAAGAGPTAPAAESQPKTFELKSGS